MRRRREISRTAEAPRPRSPAVPRPAAGAELGPCPICGRTMVAGSSVDRHHFLPRCEGGRETRWVHRICHRKVHSLFTERELATAYDTPEALRAHPDMEAFLRWIARKHPEFYHRTATSRSRAGRA